ncbi:uncharacterized protein [Anser cygnoides]|uniref:uncharacterized protein isoform X2 n=1 Tax=Anser cygnoides TaxID=8845 RepID=UPI0034D21742
MLSPADLRAVRSVRARVGEPRHKEALLAQELCAQEGPSVRAARTRPRDASIPVLPSQHLHPNTSVPEPLSQRLHPSPPRPGHTEARREEHDFGSAPPARSAEPRHGVGGTQTRSCLLLLGSPLCSSALPELSNSFPEPCLVRPLGSGVALSQGWFPYDVPARPFPAAEEGGFMPRTKKLMVRLIYLPTRQCQEQRSPSSSSQAQQGAKQQRLCSLLRPLRLPPEFGRAASRKPPACQSLEMPNRATSKQQRGYFLAKGNLASLQKSGVETSVSRVVAGRGTSAQQPGFATANPPAPAWPPGWNNGVRLSLRRSRNHYVLPHLIFHAGFGGWF